MKWTRHCQSGYDLRDEQGLLLAYADRDRFGVWWWRVKGANVGGWCDTWSETKLQAEKAVKEARG